jgi:CRISPR-associated protein Cas2
MLIVSYDFESNKTRARFARFLEKYGNRIQYSVWQVRDSERVLQNILTEVELKYKKEFTGADSIYIFRLCKGCNAKVRRYGYAKHEESDLICMS